MRASNFGSRYTKYSHAHLLSFSRRLRCASLSCLFKLVNKDHLSSNQAQHFLCTFDRGQMSHGYTTYVCRGIGVNTLGQGL